MSQGEAAEQVVNAMTNVAIKGVECVSNLAGKGALNLATFLIAVIKEEKRTKGKARMRVFNGKPTKVFVIKAKDMKTFAEEAKKYGVLYAAVYNKKQTDGLVDVVVNAADAAKVNRIAERFALSTVDVERIREEITKSRKDREGKKDISEKTDEKNADPFNLVFGAAATGPAEEQKAEEEPAVIVVRDGAKPSNPTIVRTVPPHPSERTSENHEKFTNSGYERPSIRDEIKRLQEERKQVASKKEPTKIRSVEKTKSSKKNNPKKTKSKAR